MYTLFDKLWSQIWGKFLFITYKFLNVSGEHIRVY